MNSQGDDNSSHECDDASFDLFDNDEDEIKNSTLSSSSGQVDILMKLGKNPSACNKQEESTPLYNGVHTATFDHTKKEILMVISEHKLNHEEKDRKFAISCKDEGHSFSLTSKALQNNEEHPRKRYKAQDQNDDGQSFEKSPSADMSCKSDMTSIIEQSLLPSEECAVRFSHVHDYNADVLTLEGEHCNCISSEKVETSSLQDHDMDEKETDTAVCAEKSENKAFSFPCPFCHVQESCLLLLEHHILAAHPEIPEQPEATCVAESSIANAFQFVCPLCDMDLETELAYNSHLNVAHPDGAPTDCDNLANGSLSCPLCDIMCFSDEEMARHVQTHGNDPMYYGISVNGVDSFAHSPFPDAFHNELVCPLCGQRMADADLLTSHVETHFSPQHCPSEKAEFVVVNKENIPEIKNRGSSTVSSSWELKAGSSKSKPLTSALSSKDQAVRSPSTNSAFSSKHQNGASPLSAKDVSSYKRQYERSLEQALLKGKMSVADYHEQRAELKGNDLKGVDDGYSRVDGLIEQLNRLYRQQARPGQRAYLCSPMSHFSGSHGDRGWGCGYRNFQMMLSCLINDPEYAHRIFKGGQVVIPSVPKVQQMIESAWRKGFDQDGCLQLRGRLVNTQKWIGATEIVATFASLGVRCRLVDFHAPSAPDGSHPRLLEWVTDYFTTRRPHQFTPPLYLQHQGHSRTIVGVDIDRDTRRLLLFDPGSKRDHLASLAATGLNWKCMRTFRRTQAGFRARQYQIVEVTGLLTDREYEESKIIKSERV